MSPRRCEKHGLPSCLGCHPEDCVSADGLSEAGNLPSSILWDFILCPTCRDWIPCPPKGLIPLHPVYVPPGLPDPSGAMCDGGNTFPESPEWRINNHDFPTVRSYRMRLDTE